MLHIQIFNSFSLTCRFYYTSEKEVYLEYTTVTNMATEIAFAIAIKVLVEVLLFVLLFRTILKKRLRFLVNPSILSCKQERSELCKKNYGGSCHLRFKVICF